MNMKNLSMSFGTQELFKDVNIYISPNEKVGIVGVNGAGKSTLFKIVLGKEDPSSGKISFSSNSRIEWLPQVIEDDVSSLDMNVFDYLISARPIDMLNKKLVKCYEKLATESDESKHDAIYNRINKIQKELEYWEEYSAESTLLKIIDGMNITSDILDKQISELSGGQKSKIAFAKLLYSKPEVILLDEPTNHLDKGSKDYVINYLKHYRGSIYVISHDISFLNEITTKILYLDKNRKTLELFNGNYDRFLNIYKEKEKSLENEAKLKDAEAKKLKSFIDKYSSSSGKRKRMVQDREKKLEKLLDNKIDYRAKHKDTDFKVEIARESNKVPLMVNNLVFSYDETEKKPLINKLSFSLTRGEKFLIVGKNGIGKSTLLKLIVGKLTPRSGVIKFGPKTDIAYYAQEHELLEDEKTIIDNFLEFDLTDSALRGVLARFLFTGDEVYKKVKVLSPGEKSRVALAKLSLSKANLLILDEPTNHLDPETQKIIADTFKDYKGTMLIVSHNPDFVDNLGVERTLTLPEGNISYYNRESVEYYHKLNTKAFHK